MSAVLERGPAAADEQSARAPRRRRWLRVLLAVVSGLVGFTLVAAVVGIVSYQPLGPGSMGGGGSQDVTVRTISNVYGDQLTFVRPQGGDTAHVFVSLRNNGAFPVTVKTVGLAQWVPAPSHVGFLSETQTRVRVDMQSLRTEPFTPRALDPGQEMYLTVTMTFTGCGPVSRGWTALTSLPVTYSAFGVTHTADVPLGQALALKDYHQCSIDTP